MDFGMKPEDPERTHMGHCVHAQGIEPTTFSLSDKNTAIFLKGLYISYRGKEETSERAAE